MAWKRDRSTGRHVRRCGDVVLAETQSLGRRRVRWDVYERDAGAGSRPGRWRAFSGGEEPTMAEAKRVADKKIVWFGRMR